MTNREEEVIRRAFARIESAIELAESLDGLGPVLQGIFDAVSQVAPEVVNVAAGLITEEMGSVLVGFHRRSALASDGESGNTLEQAFLAMVVVGEIKRRAELADGGEATYVLAQVSVHIEPTHVKLAASRSAFLSQVARQPVIPVVIGDTICLTGQKRADEQGVVCVLIPQ